MGIKDELVEQVLEKLRSLARVEAELMFREHKLDPSASLPPQSQRISNAITRVHDSVSQCFASMDAAERESILSTLIAEHLPPKLLEAAVGHILEEQPSPLAPHRGPAQQLAIDEHIDRLTQPRRHQGKPMAKNKSS